MIIPALLTHTKEEFISKLRSVETLVDIVHIDIMDNSLVPNTTFWNPHELSTIKTNVDYELHLMVHHPTDIIRQFAALPNIIRVYVHAEAEGSIDDAITEARYHGFEMGIAINPETSIERIVPYVSRIDAVMFMGVTPGASGRELHEEVFENIKQFHAAHPHIEIAVDGSVNRDTITQFKQAGATRFTAGSAIFNTHEKPAEAYKTLEKMIK